MQIKQYVELADSTRSELYSTKLNNLHMIMGMMTEVGELVDCFKKELAYDKQIDWINVPEEIGDLMWYIACFCKINNFDLEAILDNNIKKLATRYPEKFTQYHALNRDLNKEREILETLNHK